MSKPIDIVATWPKSKPLETYLEELRKATALDQVINYRVANRPGWEFGALRERPARCYMVHDGQVRGYCEIKYVAEFGIGEVARVASDAFAGFWPAGTYIVRDPRWRSVEPIPLRGFQGWRWFDEQEARA